MRLAFLLPGSIDGRSGGYLYDRKIVQGLRARGHTVAVHSLPVRAYAGQTLGSLPKALARRLSDGRFDLLLQDELAHPALLRLNRRLRKTHPGLPIVAVVHHLRCSEAWPKPLASLFRLLERRYLGSVDASLCTSRSTAETVRAVADRTSLVWVAEPGRDHLAYPSLDADRLRSRAARPGPLEVAFVGNLIRRKGLERLLDALDELPVEAWRLTVLGSAESERGYAGRLLRRSRGNGNVRWLGYRPHGEFSTLLPSLHVLAVPSDHEGFGIAYLEGMGFGLVPLASASGGATDLITDGQNGFLIPPGEVALLADRLRALSTDRRLLGEMAVAARLRFERHPGWDECVGRIEAFLAGLLSVSNHRTPKETQPAGSASGTHMEGAP